MQASGKGGKEAFIFGPGHMTKVAAMPICGKKILKIFIPIGSISLKFSM